MQHRDPELVSRLFKSERFGIPLGLVLHEAMLDGKAGWLRRAAISKVLAVADASGVVASQLDLFFSQSEKNELYETALTLEDLGDRTAVRPLIRALDDANPDRRHAAARALGWIPNAGRAAAKALIRVISDQSQPQPVREEAAESLAYSGYAPTIKALIPVLDEADVRMRFWAVFALGGVEQSQRRKHRTNPDAIEALERMLSDDEVAPGNWWSVGREALASLGHIDKSYAVKLDSETRRVLLDANSSVEDRRWAEAYGLNAHVETKPFIYSIE
jgi:HEAT repeat protein